MWCAGFRELWVPFGLFVGELLICGEILGSSKGLFEGDFGVLEWFERVSEEREWLSEQAPRAMYIEVGLLALTIAFS